MKLRNNLCYLVLGAALALGVVAPAQALEKLSMWITKGFYPDEDEALSLAIRRFEQKARAKVELTLLTTQEIAPKTIAALEAGTEPDLAFGHVFDFQVTGKWAAEGKLVDLSDIITPAKNRFLPNTISTTYLQGLNGKRSYYAMPIYQQTLHIQYWKDMLTEAGFSPSDIPQDWHGYWSFWCDKVQPAYQRRTGKKVYAVGLPFGVSSSDSHYGYYQFMLAYNVRLVDDNGKLLVDDPKNKAGMVSALKDYTDILAKGCTPPGSIDWKDPDNNQAFHKKEIIMTPNPTISIAAKWLDDIRNPTTPIQRATARRNYYEYVATASLPNKPDGSPMSNLAAVKTAVVFSSSKSQKLAKEFLAFLIEDANLIPYTEGSHGRWYPVTKAGADRPFWVDGKDVHRKAVSNQFRAGTGVFPFVYNYKFTVLNNENVWAKAMHRVVKDKWTPERAVDEM
ncbi:MAG TPA: ABC transporter substrate-binding protein, partial [Burkholderiales bacterium]|nr:ABC transporter substrate-binding protein [Burkholderiales bacterium]